MHNRFQLAALAAALSLVAASASAGSSSTTMQVSTSISPVCVVSAQPLSFPTYDPTSVNPLNASTTLSVNCANGTTYNVGLNSGTGVGATVSNRVMTGATHATSLLQYSLYSDATRTTNWGNTIGTDTVAGTAAATATSLTVYGQIGAGQNFPTDSFSDTVTVTISY